MFHARTVGTCALAGLALALAACDAPSDRAAPSVAPEAIKGASDTVVPPPLAVKTDVNAAVAEADMKNMASTLPGQPSKDGANQDVNVAAQDAAAKAPDTATGDEAKKRVVESGTTGNKTGEGGPGDEMTRAEESSAMPKPGQANDHSVIKPGQQ